MWRSVFSRLAWIVCLAPLACSKPPAPTPSSGVHSPPVQSATALQDKTPAPSIAYLNLLAMGDWGEGRPAQKKVADAMADYVERSRAKFAGLISAGDNFYVPLTSTHDPVWQTLFEQMYDPRRLDFPFYISLGNHDYDPGKLEVEFTYAREFPQSRWKLPARWYRLDLPADNPLLTLIILDSNHDTLTRAHWNDEIRFLESELRKPRALWTMCVAHHPLFSNGLASDNGILQSDWGTLFQKYNVDIYLCGHEHNLQHIEVPRWKSSFILAGGGGAHSHPIVRNIHEPFSRAVYGFVHLDFTPGRVVVNYLDADSEPVHVFERSKAGVVKVTLTTPSDPGVPNPLEVLQGIYEKIHPSTTQPSP